AGKALYPSREAADLLGQVLDDAGESVRDGESGGRDGDAGEPSHPPMPRPVRGELRFLRGMLLDQTGDLTRPPRLFREAVAELDQRPDLRAWAMVALGMRASPGVASRRWLERALTVLPEITDPVFAVF